MGEEEDALYTYMTRAVEMIERRGPDHRSLPLSCKVIMKGKRICNIR